MKYSHPLASIILTVFNKKNYIEETIKSIISQSTKNIEIIIVNDGSTDGSEKICQNYAQIDKRINLFNQENSGVITSRNFGIGKSTADIIIPFDADDIMAKNFVEEILYCANNNEDAQIFTTRMIIQGKGEEKLPKKIHPEKIYFRNCIPSNSGFRRSALTLISGYNENMIGGHEDYDFWLYFFDAGMHAIRTQNTYFIYQESNNSRNRNAKKNSLELRHLIYLNHQSTYDLLRPSKVLFLFFPLLHVLKKWGFPSSLYDKLSFYKSLSRYF